MIGEFLYKYTLRTIGKGLSKKKDISISSGSILIPRLYIGVQLILGRRTGRSLVRRVKCFFLVIGLLSIVIFTSSYNIHWGPVFVQCSNLTQILLVFINSIIIPTPQREMKINAPTKERHVISLNVRLFSFVFCLRYVGSEISILSA